MSERFLHGTRHHRGRLIICFRITTSVINLSETKMIRVTSRSLMHENVHVSDRAVSPRRSLQWPFDLQSTTDSRHDRSYTPAPPEPHGRQHRPRLVRPVVYIPLSEITTIHQKLPLQPNYRQSLERWSFIEIMDVMSFTFSRPRPRDATHKEYAASWSVAANILTHRYIAGRSFRK